MPLKWHRRFWQLVSSDCIGEVRLTGGEPFENRDLAKIVDTVCTAVGPTKTVYIFTSGRPVVSQQEGSRGILETKEALRQAGVVRPAVEIHMSADEHHAGALHRHLNGIQQPASTRAETLHHNELGIPKLLNMVGNFLKACDLLVQETNGAFKGGRLKVHVEQGRAEFHRAQMYGSFDDDWWDRNVVFSEGLIRAGRARDWPNTVHVSPRSIPSLFIIPGAEFRHVARHRQAQAYFVKDTEDNVFLDVADKEGNGACIVGFWNLVTRTFEGGSAVDALRLIGQPGAADEWLRSKWKE